MTSPSGSEIFYEHETTVMERTSGPSVCQWASLAVRCLWWMVRQQQSTSLEEYNIAFFTEIIPELPLRPTSNAVYLLAYQRLYHAYMKSDRIVVFSQRFFAHTTGAHSALGVPGCIQDSRKPDMVLCSTKTLCHPGRQPHFCRQQLPSKRDVLNRLKSKTRR